MQSRRLPLGALLPSHADSRKFYDLVSCADVPYSCVEVL